LLPQLTVLVWRRMYAHCLEPRASAGASAGRWGSVYIGNGLTAWRSNRGIDPGVL
jgi:hypothetical protein